MKKLLLAGVAIGLLSLSGVVHASGALTYLCTSPATGVGQLLKVTSQHTMTFGGSQWHIIDTYSDKFIVISTSGYYDNEKDKYKITNTRTGTIHLEKYSGINSIRKFDMHAYNDTFIFTAIAKG